MHKSRASKLNRFTVTLYLTFSDPSSQLKSHSTEKINCWTELCLLSYYGILLAVKLLQLFNQTKPPYDNCGRLHQFFTV